MILEIANALNEVQTIVNFCAHISIFIGALFIAVYSRTLPHWHVTPLWYVGLTSCFTAITILIEWLLGPEFPLSYTVLGLFGETALNIAIAAIAIIMMIKTGKHMMSK
jgi:hypothetical protein